MNRAVIVIALGGALAAGCKKKEAAGSADPGAVPAKTVAKNEVLPIAPEPHWSLALPDVPEPTDTEDGVDPAWVKELVPLATAPAGARPLAAVELPPALRGRLDSRLPELIGTCVTADADAATWVAARGAHLFVAGVCGEGHAYRVGVFAVDGERIAPVGRTAFQSVAIGTVTIEEAPGAICVGGPTTTTGADAAVPWHTCFAVDEDVLAARATRGAVATRLASCPAALTAIAACQGDDAFVTTIADGSAVGGEPALIRAGIAEWSQKPAVTCASWIEQGESYQARGWTVPLEDFAALTAAAAKGCAPLAVAIVDAGGLPYPTGE